MALIKIGYGKPKIFISIKQMIPMIIESIILPLINPPKVLFVNFAKSNTASAFSLGSVARITFLNCPWKRSLLFNIYTHAITPIITFIIVFRVKSTCVET